MTDEAARPTGPEGRPSGSSPLYVYAILGGGTGLPTELVGLGDAPICTVPWLNVAAAASYVDVPEHRPTPERVLRHEAVVEALRQMGPSLPVRFGTVLASRDAVARALAETYSVLLADLARLGNKVEMGLSVLWDPDREAEEADTGSLPTPLARRAVPTAVASGQQVTAADAVPSDGGRGPGRHGATGSTVAQRGPGARYLTVRLAEHCRQEHLRCRARELVRELEGALRNHIIQSQARLLPTPRLALSAAYLVEPGRVGSFEEALGEMRQAHPGLRFLLSGPWPPYSFVTPPSRQDPRELADT